VGKLNNVISNFNEDISKKPEEGIYMGDQNRIEIYFNNNQQELLHTLTHELGHALGLAHVNDNPQAIMYPYTTKTIILSTQDVAELNEVCREKSILEIIRLRFNY
jgi:predicted Zn-dependent protease